MTHASSRRAEWPTPTRDAPAAFLLGAGWAAFGPPVLKAAGRVQEDILWNLSLLLAASLAGAWAGTRLAAKPRFETGAAAGLAAWGSAVLGCACLLLVQRAGGRAGGLSALAVACSAAAAAGASWRAGAQGQDAWAHGSLGAACGLALSGVYLAGFWGERAAAAAAGATLSFAACLLAGRREAAASGRSLRIPPQASPPEGAGQHPAWDLAALILAAASAVLWARVLAFLLGTALLGAVIAGTAYAAGFALGCLAAAPGGRGGLLQASAQGPGGSAGAALGLAASGLAALNMVRFMGLAGGDPLDPLLPLATRWDLGFLAAQSLIVLLPSGLLLGWVARAAARAQRPRPAPGVPLWLAGAALAGAFGIEPLLGATRGVAALSLLSLGLGCARILSRAQLRAEPAWRSAAAAAALLGGLFAWKVLDLWGELQVHRLNQVAPGARLVERRDAGPRQLAVAEFRQGTRVLLRDGVLAYAHGIEARLLMPLLHSLREEGPEGNMLILGSGDGSVTEAARRIGGRVDVVDADLPESWRRHFFPDGAAAVGSPSSVTLGRSWLSCLRGSGPRYEVILADLPRPLSAAPSCDALTLDFLSLVKERLEPGGVFAYWVPLPAFVDDIHGAVAALSDAFPNRAAWSYPGGTGVMLLGSPEPIRLAYGRLLPALDWLPEPQRLPLSDKVHADLRVWTVHWLRKIQGRRPPSAERSELQFPAARLAVGRPVAASAEAVFTGSWSD